MPAQRRRFVLIESLKDFEGSKALVELLEDGQIRVTRDRTEIADRRKRSQDISSGYSVNGQNVRALCASEELKTLLATCGQDDSAFASSARRQMRALCGDPPDAMGESSSALAGNTSHSGGLPVAFDLGMFHEFDKARISAHPVEPVDSTYRRYGGRCFKLHNVLTPEECGYLIEHMQQDMEPVQYRLDYRRQGSAHRSSK